MKKYQYLYKQSFDWRGKVTNFVQKRISPEVVGAAISSSLRKELGPYTNDEYAGKDYYSAMMGEGDKTRDMLNDRIYNTLLKDTFDRKYGEEAINSAISDISKTPEIKKAVNTRFDKYLTEELKGTKNQKNYWEHVPESWRDNIIKMTVNTQDDNIRQSILNNMKEGMRKKFGNILDEELLNKFMSNYLQTKQGKKVYAQLFNKKMNDVTSSISGFLDKYKWPIAGAGGLGLLLLLGKGLLGGKQQPQQRNQARYINPMNRFYS